jgi:hypothetical protein
MAKRGSALKHPVLITNDALAAIVGKYKAPRTEIVKKIWAYVKKHKLQDGPFIMADQDDLLFDVFDRVKDSKGRYVMKANPGRKGDVFMTAVASAIKAHTTNIE